MSASSLSSPLNRRRLLAGPAVLLLALLGPLLPRGTAAPAPVPVTAQNVQTVQTVQTAETAEVHHSHQAGEPGSLPRTTSSRRGTATTSWSRSLQSAIDRIPDRRARSVRWVVSTRYGSWGTADWYNNTVYISPRVPERRLYDVVVHEWAHLVSTHPYDSVDDAVTAMRAYFGGQGLAGAERAADCMARMQSATWTGYTSCESARWRKGAAKLLRGEAL